MTDSLALDPTTTAFLFMDFQSYVLPIRGDRADDVLRPSAAAVAFRNAEARLRKEVSHGPRHIAVVIDDENARATCPER